MRAYILCVTEFDSLGALNGLGAYILEPYTWGLQLQATDFECLDGACQTEGPKVWGLRLNSIDLGTPFLVSGCFHWTGTLQPGNYIWRPPVYYRV